MPSLRYNRFKVEIETPYDPDLIDKLKMHIPARSRNYDPSARVWTVFSPWVTKARELVLAAFPNTTEYGTEFFQEEADKESARKQREREQEEARRAHDDYFRRQREQARQQSDGFNFGGGRYRHGSTGSDRDREYAQQAQHVPTAYATLFVTPDAPKEVIDAAYKALSRKHHPDLGGDVATMQKINAAYDKVKK